MSEKTLDSQVALRTAIDWLEKNNIDFSEDIVEGLRINGIYDIDYVVHHMHDNFYSINTRHNLFSSTFAVVEDIQNVVKLLQSIKPNLKKHK